MRGSLASTPTLCPLSPAILREEIERLLPVAYLKHRLPKAERQKKSELAVLLHEAQRTEAFRAWGVTTLGAFTSAAGMDRNVFAKYKAAGKALLDGQRDLYSAVLAAVAEKKPRPALPDVSRLRLQGSAAKQMVAQRGSMLDDLLNERRSSLRALRDLTKGASYGEADEEGARTLSALDAFLVRAQTIADLVQHLQAGEAGDVPREQATGRLAALKQQCTRLLKLANAGY